MTHTVSKCQKCNSDLPSPVVVRREGSWEVFCKKCRADFSAYLSSTDEELRQLREIEREQMAGWNEKRISPMAARVCNKPRSELGLRPAGS